MTRRRRRAAERAARNRAERNTRKGSDGNGPGTRARTWITIALAMVAVLVLIRVLGGFELPARVPPGTLVETVIDGDTIDMADGSRVRYLCIDTPERGEQLYQEATDLNRDLVGGRVVELERGLRDLDQYDRLLRYVFVGDVFVNAELVSAGLARTLIFDESEEYAALLRQLEAEAQEDGLGLWALD